MKADQIAGLGRVGRVSAATIASLGRIGRKILEFFIPTEPITFVSILPFAFQTEITKGSNLKIVVSTYRKADVLSSEGRVVVIS